MVRTANPQGESQAGFSLKRLQFYCQLLDECSNEQSIVLAGGSRITEADRRNRRKPAGLNGLLREASGFYFRIIAVVNSHN